MNFMYIILFSLFLYILWVNLYLLVNYFHFHGLVLFIFKLKVIFFLLFLNINLVYTECTVGSTNFVIFIYSYRMWNIYYNKYKLGYKNNSINSDLVDKISLVIGQLWIAVIVCSRLFYNISKDPRGDS